MKLEGMQREYYPDRGLTIALVALGGLLTFIGYFFAGFAGMAYRSTDFQSFSVVLLAYGPPVIYVASLVVAIVWMRRGKRSWPAGLAASAGPVLMWLLGLGLTFFAFTASH
jgi:hypothetical protein